MTTSVPVVGLIILVLASTIHAEVAGLRFYLYTKSNKITPVELKASDSQSFTSTFFYLWTPRTPVYLGLTESYNIVAVDWDQLSSATVGYAAAANNTRTVGREIAILMKALIAAQKSQLKDFHFIGHSLGGQVGAFISSNLDAGEKIPRVTGLDPARPGFNSSTTPPSQRLDASDADFVDVIRTSPGVDSKSTVADPPVATVDFYPNGGVKQPGCLLDITNLCSHSRAYKYYTESLTTPNGFKAYKCTSYQQYKTTTCPKINPAYMGESVSTSITGTYYLDTNSFSPFAQG